MGEWTYGVGSTLSNSHNIVIYVAYWEPPLPSTPHNLIFCDIQNGKLLSKNV